MKKVWFLALSFVLAFCFSACGDNADESAITSGTNYSKEKHAQMESVDLNSYAEVSDVFLKTDSIKSENQPYLLVFSANGCVYCERLKEMIKENADVKAFLKDNYAPYYINISYTKTHKIAFLDAPINTIELAQKYQIKPTPTLVFLSKNGKELFSYPGFMPKEKFLKALEFFKNDELEAKSIDEIKKEFASI